MNNTNDCLVCGPYTEGFADHIRSESHQEKMAENRKQIFKSNRRKAS